MEIKESDIKILIANKIIPPSANKEQILYFFEVCKRKRLDPFLKQIHMIERNEKDGKGGWIKSYTIQASLDGMRAIAQRNCKITEYRRWTEIIGSGNDREIYGCCEIKTEDRGMYSDKVPFSEYVQKTREGETTKFWKQFPQTMIKKVAEESVLRMLAPEDLSGVYGDEEMQQADVLKIKEHNADVALLKEANNEDETHVPEKVQIAPGVESNTFDPVKEIITFGKYKGLEYANCDEGYLTWLSKGENKEYSEKARLTLEYKKKIKEQVPDPFDKIFPKENKSPLEPTEEELIEFLQNELDYISKNKTLEDLELWADENKQKIEKLNDANKNGLRSLYKTIKKNLNEN